MTRQVHDLHWAKRGLRPNAIPLHSVMGTVERAGIQYENALAKAIPIADHGVWWNFHDHRGLGWCQTDLVIRGLHSDLVLEAKYSYTEKAWVQLEALYLPVVSMALGRKTLGIQVCKRFLSGMGSGIAVANDLITAIAYANEGRRTVLHWINSKYSPPLLPASRKAA